MSPALRFVDAELSARMKASAEQSIEGTANQVCLAVQTAVHAFRGEDRPLTPVYDGLARAIGGLMAKDGAADPAALARSIAEAAVVYHAQAVAGLASLQTAGRA